MGNFWRSLSPGPAALIEVGILFAPAPLFDEALRGKTEKKIILPLIEGLKKEGIDYRGVLYIGLMVEKGEPCP